MILAEPGAAGRVLAELGSRARTVTELLEDVGIPVALLVFALAAMGWFFWYIIRTKWPEEVKAAREDAQQAREDLKTERTHFDALLEKVEAREDERLDKILEQVDALAALVRQMLSQRNP